MGFENPHIEIEKPIEREKFSEEVLNEKRREFAKKELEIESQGLKGKKIEDIEKAQETALVENDYRDALKGQRKELLEKIPEKERKEKSQEILIKTVAEEATKLYGAKTELKLEGKRDSRFEKIKNIAGRTVDRYRKLPLSKKLLVSAVLFTGGIGAGAIGGAAGAALATGVITGRWFQRVFGGAATAVGLEGLIKRSQEKEERKGVIKEFGGNILGILEKENSKLDQKIFELEAGKKGKERRRYALAGAMGVLVGSGAVAKAMQNVFHLAGDAYHKFFGGGAKIAPEAIKAPAQEVIPSTKAGSMAEMPPKPAMEMPPPILTIGERGPEGAIIDYFKDNPDIAKKFGWDGEVDLDKWTGTKAHQLWLEDANEALAKPGTLEQLKNLGYSPDTEGYAKMMHRLGKGAVEINTQTGEINLVDTEYLKAPVAPEVPSEVAPQVPPEAPPTTEAIPPTETEPRVDLDKKIAGLENEYNKARLRLLEANVKSYTSDLPREEIQAEIDKYYQESAGLEKQIEELKAAKIIPPEIPKAEVIPPVEAPVVKVAPEIEAVPKAPEISPGAHILPLEKQGFLDNLIYEDTRLANFKVNTLVEQIKTGKLTPEDFSKYYASKIGAERVSDKMLDGFKYNFKAISGTNAVERLKAEGVMAAFLKRLESIK